MTPAVEIPRVQAVKAEGTAVAFGTSAAVTLLFNTLLTWVKEAYEPVHSLMASVTGHHWWTHGLIDVAVFLLLGAALMPGSAGRQLTRGNILALAAAVLLAAIGLAGWFAVV